MKGLLAMGVGCWVWVVGRVVVDVEAWTVVDVSIGCGLVMVLDWARVLLLLLLLM